MQDKKSRVSDNVFWIVVAIIGIVVYLSIRTILQFAEERSPIIFESYAAILGATITVTVMTILMRLQVQHEKEKEFSARLFDKKVELYGALLETIFRVDDDNVISKQEIQDIENKIGNTCLVAGEKLVSIFSQFMYQLKVYGVVYLRSMNDAQLEHFARFVESEKAKKDINDSFLSPMTHALRMPARGNEEEYFIALDELIQGIRDDLSVVEGDVKRDIETFIRTEFDKYEMMSRPNVVD